MDHLGVINTTMWLVIDWWVLMVLIVWLVVGRLDGRWERFGRGSQRFWSSLVLVVNVLGHAKNGPRRYGEWLVLVLANDLWALVTSLEFLES